LLGALRVHYAEGAIRKSVSWFAIHLDNKGEGILLARRNPGPESTASDIEGVLELLRQASVPRPIDFSSVDEPDTDLDGLEDRRRRLRGQLQEIKEEIADVERLNRDASEFETEAREQEARLASIGLIKSPDDHSDICPVCESHLSVPVPSVTEIRNSLAGIGHQLATVRRDSPRLQGRIAGLESQRGVIKEQLRTVQQELATRIRDNERLRLQQEHFTEQARVGGRIGYYLENVTAIATDSRLQQAIERLRAELAELEKALDDDTSQSRLDTALSLVNRDLTEYARRLGLEHGDNPLRLDLKNLTIVADTVDGPLSLSQMGSGENWVGYHVAAHLSMHRLFVLRKRPVPAFLMLDQPSQAHYPPERDENGRIDGVAYRIRDVPIVCANGTFRNGERVSFF
jgi:chaperonin cofactor prefoldin